MNEDHYERQSGVGKGSCVTCRQRWPCSYMALSIQYAAALKRSRQLVVERDLALARAERAEAGKPTGGAE